LPALTLQYISAPLPPTPPPLPASRSMLPLPPRRPKISLLACRSPASFPNLHPPTPPLHLPRFLRGILCRNLMSLSLKKQPTHHLLPPSLRPRLPTNQQTNQPLTILSPPTNP